VIGGIPGSADADTQFDLVLDDDMNVLRAVFIGLLDLNENEYLDPGFLYSEGAGEVTADAGSSNAFYRNITIDTSETSIDAWSSLSRQEFDALWGRELIAFLRMRDAGSDLQAQLELTGGPTVDPDFISVTPDASTFELEKTLTLAIPVQAKIWPPDLIGSGASLNLLLKRTTGSAAADIDYISVLPRPVVKIGPTAVASAEPNVRYRLHQAVVYGANNIIQELAPVSGDALELRPNKLNILISVAGDIHEETLITWGMTYTINVRPRWSLL
jgi:hypothetical protein